MAFSAANLADRMPGPPSSASTYMPRDKPQLVLDTRTDLGGHHGAVQAGEVVTQPMRGVAGVPANATAVITTMRCEECS